MYFGKAETLKNNGMDEIGLVTPTQGPPFTNMV